MFYSNLQNPELCLIQVSNVEDTDHNSNATFWQAIHYKDRNYAYTDTEGPIVPKINHSNATNFRTTSLFTM